MKKVLLVLFVLVLAFSAFAKGAEEKKAEAMELVIFNAGSETEGQMLIDAFTAKYPNVSVTQLQADSSTVLSRVQLAGDNPDGDVVVLIAQDSLDVMKDNLQPYKTANDAKFEAGYKDPEYKWYASSMPLQALMYNTDMLKGNDIPKSWYDLTDPKYYGKIVLANPSSSGSAYAQLYMMYKLTGDLSLAAGIAANGTTYVASSTAGPAAVERGEYALTMTGEKNISTAISNGSPVMYFYPKEGTGRRIEGSGIIANCKNLEAAKLFMDFLTSKEGAEVIREMGRRPVSTEVPGPANLPALDELPFFEYDATEAGELKKDLRKNFDAFIQ